MNKLPYGLKKCTRAILGGYEVQDVRVFGWDFNCKPIQHRSGKSGWVWLSHTQIGVDDQIFFKFELDSRDQYIANSLRYNVWAGRGPFTIPRVIAALAKLPWTKFIGGRPWPQNYAAFVTATLGVRNKSKPRDWERSAGDIIIAVIAELGNPERRGVALPPVPCRRPTVYAYDNYRGLPLRVLESIADIHRINFGDNISSICVPRGWILTAYEHRNYKGKSLVVGGPYRFEDLKRQRGFGDKISSIRVTRR